MGLDILLKASLGTYSPGECKEDEFSEAEWPWSYAEPSGGVQRHSSGIGCSAADRE